MIRSLLALSVVAGLAGSCLAQKSGEPLRPEFAAWRYGDQFGRRRRRQILIAGGGVAALGVLVTAGITAGVGIGGFGWIMARYVNITSSAVNG